MRRRTAATGSAYGASGSAWRPFFREQELPLADYAAIAAEQLDFAVQVTDIAKAHELFSRAPGVILIDPWYIAERHRLDVFRQAINNLPHWVLPVLVPDVREASRAELLVGGIRILLGDARSEPARQGLSGVSSLSTFVTLMPFLVAEAEREYLWHGPPRRAIAGPSQPLRKTPLAVASSIPRADKLPGHAFISYVREDSAHVGQLQALLQIAGVPIWRDTSDLWPGDDWRVQIRKAITGNALVFLACFSSNSLTRSSSYQNEELTLAIEQLRQRRFGDPWLIPIRFDECDIPDYDIGSNRTLQSIQRVDLFGDRYEEEAIRLVAGIKRILEGS